MCKEFVGIPVEHILLLILVIEPVVYTQQITTDVVIMLIRSHFPTPPKLKILVRYV